MAYRSKGSDDSSSASDSDDETFMSWKRKKNVDEKKDTPMESEFVNPILEQKKTTESGGKLPTYLRFRKNNIWGNVIQEQTLSNVISKVSTDVDTIDTEKIERDVESYSYNRNLQPADLGDHFRQREDMASDRSDAEEDYFKPSVKDRLGHRPNTPMDGSSGDEDKKPVKDRLGKRSDSEEDIADRSGDDNRDNEEMEHDSRRRNRRRKSRKRTLRDRLGPHGYKQDPLSADFEPPKMYSVKPKVPVSIDDSQEVIVNALVENLREPKVDLISQVVEAIGKQKTLDLFSETETIEENGGLLINNNTRRRTPGGVFFFLLRSDKSIDEDVKQSIFSGDRKKAKQERQERQERFKKVEAILPQYKYSNQKKGPPGRSKSLDSSSENKERPKSSSHSASSSPTTRAHDNSPEQATMETVEEVEGDIQDFDIGPKTDAETGEKEEGEIEDGELIDDDD